MLMFIKLTVLIQINKIISFLLSYEASLSEFNITRFANEGYYEGENWMVLVLPGTNRIENFRRLCINSYHTPFYVEKSFNLTELFLFSQGKSCWVDLYKSKSTGLLLDRTDFPPALETNFGNKIIAERIYSPLTIPAGVIDTHFFLSADLVSQPREDPVVYTFNPNPS